MKQSPAKTVKVEIWSDVVCPFCYIGKRRLEAAIGQVQPELPLEIQWKSFQLDPTAPTEPRASTYEMLARKYQMSLEQARQMTENVARMAASAGLRFDFDRVVPANSFDAHRLIQFAASRGLQDQVEERLFAAHFCEGLNIADRAVLERLGAEIGLGREELRAALDSEEWAAQVRTDCDEAGEFGIRGVPFFVINRKYAISGAQPVEAFVKALQTALMEPEEKDK